MFRFVISQTRYLELWFVDAKCATCIRSIFPIGCSEWSMILIRERLCFRIYCVGCCQRWSIWFKKKNRFFFSIVSFWLFHILCENKVSHNSSSPALHSFLFDHFDLSSLYARISIIRQSFGTFVLTPVTGIEKFLMNTKWLWSKVRFFNSSAVVFNSFRRPQR